MGFLRDRFLYRDDYFPALQGLRGLAVLWFFHWNFYAHFDTAKVARLMDGRPWMEGVIGAALVALAPAAMVAPQAMWVLGGFLAERFHVRASLRGGPAVPGVLCSRLARFYPVFLVSMLPILVYTGCDFSRLAWALTFFVIPQDIPAGNMVLLANSFWTPLFWAVLRAATGKRSGLALPVALFLGLAGLDLLVYGDPRITAAFMAVLAGATAARFAHAPSPDGAIPFTPAPPDFISRRGPGLPLALVALLPLIFMPYKPWTSFATSLAVSILLALAVVSLRANARSFTARLLSHPLLRYFGATALPFYLIHATWGFRLSRAILQTELRSPADIAAHWAISLGVSALAAGFLHVFFERPRFLRNAPSADTHPSSATQGASP